MRVQVQYFQDPADLTGPCLLAARIFSVDYVSWGLSIVHHVFVRQKLRIRDVGLEPVKRALAVGYVAVAGPVTSG